MVCLFSVATPTVDSKLIIYTVSDRLMLCYKMHAFGVQIVDSFRLGAGNFSCTSSSLFPQDSILPTCVYTVSDYRLMLCFKMYAFGAIVNSYCLRQGIRYVSCTNSLFSFKTPF